jgi:hypothetical protein
MAQCRAIVDAPPTPEFASLHPGYRAAAIHGPHGMEWQG